MPLLRLFVIKCVCRVVQQFCSFTNQDSLAVPSDDDNFDKDVAKGRKRAASSGQEGAAESGQQVAAESGQHDGAGNRGTSQRAAKSGQVGAAETGQDDDAGIHRRWRRLNRVIGDGSESISRFDWQDTLMWEYVHSLHTMIPAGMRVAAFHNIRRNLSHMQDADGSIGVGDGCTGDRSVYRKWTTSLNSFCIMM